MEWKVVNALSRDVERQHLNKILSDIRRTVSSLSISGGRPGQEDVESIVGAMVEGNREVGINVTYNPVSKVLDFAVANLTVRLEGDVTGTASTNSLGTVVLNTTLEPSARGVEEAPVDDTPYWRQNAEWYKVPRSVFSLADIDEAGILSMDDDGGIYGVEIEGVENEIDIVNGRGLEGNPSVGLADLEDTGEGQSPVKLFTRDSKGRLEGTEDADTDDLPEGDTNLYFTDERAQDAAGSILDDSGDVELHYETSPARRIWATLSAVVQDALTAALSALQPGDNVSELVNDAGYVVRSDFSGALVAFASAQSLPDNTDTKLTFGAETYDTDGYHDNVVNPSRLTVPTDGVYVVSAGALFAANSTGWRRIQLFKNDAAFPGRLLALQGAVTVATGAAGTSAPIVCSAGDYFEVGATQTSGGALNVLQNNGTWFAIRRVADLS